MMSGSFGNMHCARIFSCLFYTTKGPEAGIEPASCRMRADRSTNELPRELFWPYRTRGDVPCMSVRGHVLLNRLSNPVAHSRAVSCSNQFVGADIHTP